MRIEVNDILRKRYVRAWELRTRRALAMASQEIVARAGDTDPERLKLVVRTHLKSEPIHRNLVDLWTKVGGKYGYDTEKRLSQLKGGTVSMERKQEDEQLSLWEERMKRYSAERSLKFTGTILTAEEEAINSIIDQTIQQSLDQGLGIVKTRALLRNNLEGDMLRSIEKWQAQRIAMTEVGAASNSASWQAMVDSGLKAKKNWVFIPGLKTYRENHAEFGSMGPQEKDYEYAPGLKFPHDPDCNDPGETINCYCGVNYDVD